MAAPTQPVANTNPIIPNEKNFFSHSMHYQSARYGHDPKLFSRGATLLYSTIGSDTRFWMRAPEGPTMHTFAEINSGISKNTQFVVNGTGSHWNYSGSECKTCYEREYLYTGSDLFGIVEGDSIILHNRTANAGVSYSGSQFVYTNGVLTKLFFDEDKYATASYVSGTVDDGYWPSARLLHISFSTVALEGLAHNPNWFTTSSSGVSPYYMPAGVHTLGKALEYAINHYSQHVTASYEHLPSEMMIFTSSVCTASAGWRLNGLDRIDLNISKSDGSHAEFQDTLFDPWETRSYDNTQGWGYITGEYKTQAGTETAGITWYDNRFYEYTLWGKDASGFGPYISNSVFITNDWKVEKLDALNLKEETDNDDYAFYIWSQSLSMSIENFGDTHPLQFTVGPGYINDDTRVGGSNYSQFFRQSSSLGPRLPAFHEFADGADRKIKKSTCECISLKNWINIPQHGQSGSAARYRLTFSDGYSFTAGALLRLFSYNPLFPSATQSIAGLPSPNNSGMWPHSLTTRTPAEMYVSSSSFENQGDVAFIKCADIIPGNTQTAGFVYLTSIERYSDTYPSNSAQDITNYNWTYDSDYHFSINSSSDCSATHTGSLYPHMTRVETYDSDIWNDLLSGWLMLENGLYVGFENCKETHGSCGVGGCTSSAAINYNPDAIWDDGSCVFCVYGCQDPNALNYNPSATCSGSCTYCVYGCMDNTAANYNANATCPCDETVGDGNTTQSMVNSGVNTPPGKCCDYCYYGCTEPTASNYDPLATCDDGSCYDCDDFEVSFTITEPCCKYNDNEYPTQSLSGDVGPLTGIGFMNAGTYGSYSTNVYEEGDNLQVCLTGSFMMMANGGTSAAFPFTYSWWTTAGVQLGSNYYVSSNNAEVITSSILPNTQIYGLVQDNNGCAIAQLLTMGDNVVEAPLSGTLQIRQTVHATTSQWDEYAQAGARVIMQGGTPPYTFSWSGSSSGGGGVPYWQQLCTLSFAETIGGGGEESCQSTCTSGYSVCTDLGPGCWYKEGGTSTIRACNASSYTGQSPYTHTWLSSSNHHATASPGYAGGGTGAIPINTTISEVAGLVVQANINKNYIRVNVSDANGCTWSASSAPEHIKRNTISGCTHSDNPCYDFYANKNEQADCC